MKLSRYFQRSEFICNGVAKDICNCGYDTVDKLTFDCVMAARVHFNSPLIVTSAARCLAYNRYIGSNDTSQHVAMRAVDHYVVGVPIIELYNFYKKLFEDNYGLGIYDTFVHVDTRTNGPARWDGRTLKV